MTSTMPVPSHAQNGAGARVSALLIPADPERPVQRLEISGKDDLSAALGGHIEGVPCHHDSTIWGYVNTLGKYTAGGEPNARASSVLSPGKGWITGDVVLIAFDEHREECDLPIGIEDRITATERLPTAPLMVRAGRSIVHEWEVNSSDNGSQLLATLTIGHYPAIDRRAQRYGGEFRALLANRTEEPGLFGETIHGEGPAAFCVRREGAWSFTDAQLDSFTSLALARLQALYAARDERVTGYFKGQP